MTKKQIEKIPMISVQISTVLWNEINSAKNNLNLDARLNSIGKKKETYSFKEASHRLGKWLKARRKRKQEDNNIYKL